MSRFFIRLGDRIFNLDQVTDVVDNGEQLVVHVAGSDRNISVEEPGEIAALLGAMGTPRPAPPGTPPGKVTVSGGDF